MLALLESILTGLLTNIVWLPIGVLLPVIGFWLKVRLPNKKLWRVNNSACLTVCAATSTVTNTGAYNRPATGIGQVRALALATKSLSRAYNKNLDIQNIILSVEPLQERIENDLLILGGPKNNRLADKFLELLLDEQPAFQVDNEIIWRTKYSRGKWLNQGAVSYEGQTVNRRVEIDYGLIIRAQSPFTSRKRTVILFSGSHTYGTVAAAKFFTEELNKHLRKMTQEGRENFSLLISTHIVDGHPTKLQIERSYAW